jgi:tRNA G18 (ribose-2'-O)-methylase SpoU
MKTETVIRQCVRKACMFRFPGPDGEAFPCPKCGASTTVVALLPKTDTEGFRHSTDTMSDLVLDAGLDNIRSVLNVGSIFRTADGVGIHHIHLFGITPSPAHPTMRKTALGADETLPWTQHWDGLQAVRELKKEGFAIWSLEKNHDSQNLFTTPLPEHSRKILIVAGNENSGVDPGILAESDQIIHLPMIGKKESLNVANAFAIAAYWLRFSQG